jgi:acyl-CoA thioester hydrolase/thioesterase-3
MYPHVHRTHSLDDWLAARFGQMERCWGMGMDAFARRGLGSFVRTASIQDRRRPGLETR